MRTCSVPLASTLTLRAVKASAADRRAAIGFRRMAAWARSTAAPLTAAADWPAGDLGWVLSENRLHGPAGAKGPSEVVTETMLLARTADGWKITHVHWSGRHAG